MHLRPVKSTLRVCLIVGLAATPLGAQQDASSETSTEAFEERSEVDIRPAAGPITVDAELDDAGWANAAVVRDFIEFTPREGAEPPVETEVRLTYDEANLYVSFLGRDPRPQDIRSTLQPRDLLWNDDWVGVLLDPHGDGSLGYYFLSNPIGVQGDLQLTSRREDSSIDFVYSTAGRLTDDGYIVEMAIPFRSLRVPDRDIQTWGIMLVRNYPRSSRHSITWPTMSRNNACQLCQLARLEGLEGLRTGGSLDLLPALVVSQAGQLASPSDPGSFHDGDVQAQPSLGVRYSFQRGWTAEATVNPDFSQIESDAAQIDVNTTFALFYPERRPFFQEGMDIYQTPLNVLYSRSINAPEGAAKVTGRAGGTSLGYIGARDEHTPFIIPFEERTGLVQAGSSFTNVVRLQHDFDGSHVGALLTDRRLEGLGSGTTMSTDGLYRFDEIHSLAAHFALSHTQEPDDTRLSAQLPELNFGDDGTEHTAAFDGESFTGHATSLFLARNARTWSWNALYLGLSPTYRADTGFQAQNNYRRATVQTVVSFYPNRHGVEQVSGGLFGGGYWNFQGERKQTLLGPSLHVTLPRQTQVGINTLFRQETFRGVELTGIREYELSLNSSFSDALRFGFNVGTGRRVARNIQVPEVGEGTDFSMFAAIKPVQQVMIEPSISYQQLHLSSGEELFSGFVARSRFNYQYNRELQFRMVLQYDDFQERLDVEPLLAYRLNPFSVFYLGSTYGSRQFDERGMVRTDRQYFAKLQYLFRR